jgi:DNA polymerase-3 subunit beta
MSLSFTMKKAPFLSGLERASATVSSKDNDPILKTFHLQADTSVSPAEVRILSTDLTLGSIAKIKVVDIDEPGAVAIPAEKIRQIVRSAEDGDIQFKVEGNQATVKAGRATWTINVLSVEEYPEVPVFDPANAEEVSREALLDVIQKVRYAASTESTRPSLMLIAFNGERAAASDGARLQWADFKGLAGVQIPIFAVNNLVRLLNRSEVEAVRVELKKNHLLFQIGSDTYSTQRLYDEFPDVEKAILSKTDSNELELSIDKVALIAAVERVRLSADQEKRQIDLVVQQPANGGGPTEIEIRALDSNGELATETLSCSTTLEAGRRILVNHVFLTDMLNMTKAPQVKFRLGADQRARRSMLRLDEPGLRSVLAQLRPEE